MRVQIPPGAKAAVAQRQSKWQNTRAESSRRRRYRDGAEQRYFDDYDNGAVSPVAVLIYSSRFEVVDAKNCVAESAERQTKLDVVKGQGYFACHAGGRGFESQLVQLGASSAVDRAPNVPDRLFPSSDFRSLHLRKQRKEAVMKRSVTKLASANSGSGRKAFHLR
jgi:hypothetical protein